MITAANEVMLSDLYILLNRISQKLELQSTIILIIDLSADPIQD